jgi:hypothetical protein
VRPEKAYQSKELGQELLPLSLYLGLFCLPILFSSIAPRLGTKSIILRFLPPLSASAFALVSVYFGFNRLGASMPISGNILISQGLGPLYTAASYDRLPSLFWSIVTVLSLLGGALLVKRMTASTVILIGKIRMGDLNDDDVIQIFLLAAVGAYALPILVAGFFDRYLVPLVPFVLYLSASGLRREGVLPTASKPGAAVLVAFTALFAVLGTRDYLTWHRVSWAALT